MSNLLGSPIGSARFCNECVRGRVEKICQGLEKMDLIQDPQVEFQLIRSCMGYPKMSFALRSAPSGFIQDAVKMFDREMDRLCSARFGLGQTEEQKKQWNLR